MKLTYSLFAFLIAFSLSSVSKAQHKVLLDTYFNNEYKKNSEGKLVPFHYRWEETALSGFSILGNVFEANGFELASLSKSPTKKQLKPYQVYVIVDPDTEKETANPNFMNNKAAKEIAAWVKQGGVLLLFANDSANVELKNFNKLANIFGINFNNKLINHVTNDVTREGGGVLTMNSPIFKTAKQVYMKDACSITVSGNAFPLLKQKEDIIIAGSTYGKGTVVAIGDPWLYNEYVNGNLQVEFENDKGAADLVKYLKSKIN